MVTLGGYAITWSFFFLTADINVVDGYDKVKDVGCHVVNGLRIAGNVGYEQEFGLLVSQLLAFILGAFKVVEYLASISRFIDIYIKSLSKQ